jgi:hypothetical protein
MLKEERKHKPCSSEDESYTGFKKLQGAYDVDTSIRVFMKPKLLNQQTCLTLVDKCSMGTPQVINKCLPFTIVLQH